jgi:hypothetical protein
MGISKKGPSRKLRLHGLLRFELPAARWRIAISPTSLGEPEESVKPGGSGETGIRFVRNREPERRILMENHPHLVQTTPTPFGTMRI